MAVVFTCAQKPYNLQQPECTGPINTPTDGWSSQVSRVQLGGAWFWLGVHFEIGTSKHPAGNKQ